MARKIVSVLLIFICYILQTTILSDLSFNGISANLMIILVASFGFMSGETYGMAIGFLCGLLMDVFNGDVLGLYALLYMGIGYINGAFQRIYYPEDIKLPLILILGSDLLFGILCYLILFLLRNRLDMWFYIKNVIVPETVYTIVIAFAVYPILLLIHNRLDAAERRSNE